MSKLAKTILRLTLMTGFEPTTANGQGDSCPVGNRDASDKFWIGVTMFALVFSWLVLGATAFWFWKQVDKRLHWNELQQAEAHTFFVNQRDAVGAARGGLERLSTRLDGHVQDFQAYVEQSSNEVSVLEDYIHTLRYGVEEQALQRLDHLLWPYQWMRQELLVKEEKKNHGQTTTWMMEALVHERFADANEMQGAIMLVLHAIQTSTGLSFDLVDGIQKCFRRLQRSSRNSGEHWLSEVYGSCAEDFQLLTA
eukprot:s4480_g2.t1